MEKQGRGTGYRGWVSVIWCCSNVLTWHALKVIIRAILNWFAVTQQTQDMPAKCPPTAQQIHRLLGHRNARCYVIFSHETLYFTVMSQVERGGGGPGTLAKTHQTVWMFCPRRHQQGFPYGYKWSVILARATIRFNVKQENEMKIQIRYLLNPMLIKKKTKKNSFKNRPSKALRSKTDLKRHVQTAAHVFSNPCTLAWLRSTIYTSHCAVKLVDPIQTGCMLIL